jgi:hypothetical protein
VFLKDRRTVFKISQKSVLNIADTAKILDNLLHRWLAAAVRIDGVLRIIHELSPIIERNRQITRHCRGFADGFPIYPGPPVTRTVSVIIKALLRDPVL